MMTTSFVLTEGALFELRKIAAVEGRTTSAIIRMAIADFLGMRGKNDS